LDLLCLIISGNFKGGFSQSLELLSKKDQGVFPDPEVIIQWVLALSSRICYLAHGYYLKSIFQEYIFYVVNDIVAMP